MSRALSLSLSLSACERPGVGQILRSSERPGVGSEVGGDMKSQKSERASEEEAELLNYEFYF